MKRVVVSGVTGMIGSALCDRLSVCDVEVLALVNPSSKRTKKSVADDDPNISPLMCAAVEYREFARSPIAAKMPRHDVFYHLAWVGSGPDLRDDEDVQQCNVELSCEAVSLAHALGCTRFVFAGSYEQYGMLEAPFDESTPCAPTNAYGSAKLEAEQRTRELCHELGLSHVAMRFAPVYGPGDADSSLLVQAIWHAWHEEPFSCSPCEQAWEYLYCDDAAEALRLVGCGDVAGDAIYPLGSGQVRPLRDYVNMACEVCNPGFEPTFGALSYPQGQVMRVQADSSRLKDDTGFQALMPFEEGIRRTAQWYRDMLTTAPEMPWEKYGGLDASI